MPLTAPCCVPVPGLRPLVTPGHSQEEELSEGPPGPVVLCCYSLADCDAEQDQTSGGEEDLASANTWDQEPLSAAEQEEQHQPSPSCGENLLGGERLHTAEKRPGEYRKPNQDVISDMSTLNQRVGAISDIDEFVDVGTYYLVKCEL